MTDLGEEFESALRRAKDARPGLGFGLGLALPSSEKVRLLLYSSIQRTNAQAQYHCYTPSASHASGSLCPTEASTEYDNAECRCKLEKAVVSEGIRGCVRRHVECIIVLSGHVQACEKG